MKRRRSSRVGVGSCVVDDLPQLIVAFAGAVRKDAELVRTLVRFVYGVPKSLRNLPRAFCFVANDLGTSPDFLGDHPIVLGFAASQLCDLASRFGSLSGFLGAFRIVLRALIVCAHVTFRTDRSAAWVSSVSIEAAASVRNDIRLLHELLLDRTATIPSFH